MIDAIQPGEIVYATITTISPKAPRRPERTFECKTVFSLPYSPVWDEWLRIGNRSHADILQKMGATCDVKVTGLQVLVRCGFKNKGNEIY